MKNKLISIFLCIVFLFTSFCISAFGYHSAVEIKSSDWVITSPDTYRKVYPQYDSSYIADNSPSLNHSYLNGETYFYSLYWNDEDYERIESHTFFAPEVNGEWFGSGESYGSEAHYIIFESGDTFFMAVFYNVNSVFVTDEPYHSQRDLQFDISGCIGEVDFYKITYPFSMWRFVRYADFYGNDDIVSFANGQSIEDVTIWFSDTPIYNYKCNSVVKSADLCPYTSPGYVVDYGTPISVLEGSTSFTVDSLMLNKLEFGSFAFMIDNLGFITAMDTGFLSFTLSVSFYQNGQLIDSAVLSDFSYDSLYDDYVLEFGKDYITSVVEILDINGEFPDGVEMQFDFTFVTDSFNLFFPPSISFVEFENYEDDLEHNEVLDSIQSATDILNGTINTTSDKLAQEIVNSANSIIENDNVNVSVITSTITNSTNEITDGITDLKDKVSDKLDEVKDGITDLKDNVSDKLNEVKDGIIGKLQELGQTILNGIKSLFIPPDEFFDTYFDNLNNFFTEKLGFLKFPFDLISLVLDKYTNLQEGSGKIHIPEFTLEIQGVKQKLIDKQDFDLKQAFSSLLGDKYNMYYAFVDAIIILGFVYFAKRKFDEVVGGK